jgi:molybdate transport system substrate-binding protein
MLYEPSDILLRRYRMRVLFAAAMVLFTLRAGAGEVRVFAAASLTDALEEIAALYERQSGDEVVFNFGSSGTLARQIERGAPADLFLSADQQRMDGLERRGLVAPRTRVSVLSNVLAVVVPRDSPAAIASVAQLAKLRSVAIADPADVPAGAYARAFLTRAGVWERMAPNIIPTANVRAALAAVESENVDAAIVYRTDALISRKVRVALLLTGPDASPVSYPFAILAGAENRAAADRLLAWLRSPAAMQVFVRHGFIAR